LFQVTPTGDIVWEYINPYPRRGTDVISGKPTVNHQLYRAQPVPYEWAPAGTPRSERAVAPLVSPAAVEPQRAAGTR
jgi:hypothetical protein